MNYTRRNRSDPDLTADALCRNAQNRNRTSDTRIFSPLLYQLSYLGLCCLMYALASATKIILTSFCISVNTFFKIMKIFCYYSARSVRSLRRPYENRPAGSIRPGAKRLEWPDAVTARPKAMKEAKVIYDKDFAIGDVDRRMFGSFVEHLGRCVYGGIYEPEHETADANGFRGDVKELMKELGVTHIRYPGGNFVSGYDWKDGVGPKEKRPVRKDMAWNVLETNQVGTNEFAALMKELGIDLTMAVNLGTGTPKDAGELVEYCNVKGGTYWSELRKSHGVEEPYGFKTWCLGNEMDGEWQICMHTAEEYARLCKETAKIVKWMDPKAETIACGSCTNEIGHSTFGDWDRKVLEECYDYIDYLSLHRYFNYNPRKQLAYSMIRRRIFLSFSGI